MPQTSERPTFSERMIFWRLRRRLPAKIYTRFRVEASTPEGRAEADELIVSKFGVFVVKVVRMRGVVTGKEDEPMWVQRHFGRSMAFANPLLHAHDTTRGLADFLALPMDSMHALVIFTGAKFSEKMPANIFEGHGFVEYIRSFYEEILPPSEVQRVNAAFGDLKKRPAPAPPPPPTPLPSPASSSASSPLIPPAPKAKAAPKPKPDPKPAPAPKSKSAPPPEPKTPTPPTNPVQAAEKKLRDDLRAALAAAPPERPRPAARPPDLVVKQKSGGGRTRKAVAVVLFLLFGVGLGLFALSFVVDLPRLAPETLNRPAFRMSIPALAQPSGTPATPSISSPPQPKATLQPPTAAVQPPDPTLEPPPSLAFQPSRPITSPLQPPAPPLQMPDDLAAQPASPLRLDPNALEPAPPSPTPGIQAKKIPDDEPAAPGKVRAFRATVDGQDVRDPNRSANP